MASDNESLHIRIVPELDKGAVKSVEDQLNAISPKVPIGGTGKGGTGGGSVTPELKAQKAELKEILATIRAKIDAEDLALRTARANAREQIELLRQQAAQGKITNDQMVQDIAAWEAKTEMAVSQARASYAELNQELGYTEQQFRGVDGAQQQILNRQKQLFYATERMNTGFTSMSGSMGQITSQTKATNLAFMNFGRIIQDLPFGLIGIANNIDPMAVTFSDLTKEIDKTTGRVRGFGGAIKALGSQLLGPAGLIFLIGSALPSALLMFQSIQRSQTKETNEAVEATTNWVSTLFELRAKFDLAADGLISKEAVLKKYNDTVGKTIGSAEDWNEADEKLFANTDEYIMALFKRTQAQALLTKQAELYVKIITGQSLDLKWWQQVIRFASGMNSEFAKMALAGMNTFDVLEEMAKAQGEINKLFREGVLGMDEGTDAINKQKDESNKFIDRTLEQQALLKIAYENNLYLAQDENLTYDQRQKYFDQAIASRRSELALQRQSVQAQLDLATDEQARINLSVQLINLGQESLEIDRQAAKFAQERADAVFQEWMTRQQMILTLRDELSILEQKSLEEMLPIDDDTSNLDLRLDLAREEIDRQTNYEIEAAIRAGDRIKALEIEKNAFLQAKYQEYLNARYSADQAMQMATAETNREFANAEKDIRIEAASEIFQAAGQFASEALNAIFGKNKEVAIAQVIIDTAMGIQKIWANSGMNPIVGGLLTAALAAKGVATIAKISKTEVGDTGSGSPERGGNILVSQVTERGTQAQGMAAMSVAANAAPPQMDARPINVYANVDRRGLAIAVREGERNIRTQQFDYR